MVRAGELEEIFAAMVYNQGGKGGIRAYMCTYSFECNVKCSERCQACGIRVSLVIGIKNVDENAEELENRGKAV